VTKKLQRSIVRTKFGFGGTLVFALIIAPYAHADIVSFTTVAGSDSDGSLAATVTFTAVAGGIDVTITNTESGAFAKGQAVSGLSFMVTGLNTPTGFTDLKGESYNPSGGGVSWALASGATFDNTSPVNAIDHWGFSTSGANVLLETAGSNAPPQNPQYMILPSSGTAGPGSSLANSNFYPYIIGPATFFLADSAVTATTVLDADISSVDIGFGTGPDKTLGTTLVSRLDPVPEPTSMLLFGTLMLLFILVVRRRSVFA
jgi:hypothetical protein